MRKLLVLVSVFLLFWLAPVMAILVIKTTDGIPLPNFLITATAATHLFWYFVLRKLP